MRTLPTGSKRGFTLLELLVVMAIMVLLSGAVLATMAPALAEARLRSASAQLVSALRFARSHAVSRHVPTRLRLDIAARTSEVQVQETADDGTQAWRTLTTQAGRRRALPEGVAIEAAQAATETEAAERTVTFTALGRGEDASLTITDSAGRGRTIRVDAVTGRCAMAEVAP
jgi:type II secretion system protein H